MVAHLTRALAIEPRSAAAHEALAGVRLARGQAGAVRRQLDTLAATTRTVGLRVALADAKTLGGEAEAARALYAEAHSQMPQYAHDIRARLMLRDAVAARPRVVRVLVSGDSAAVQARRLGMIGTREPAVQAWRAVRRMDARRYGAALSGWRQEETPVRPERPRAWHRAWTLQRRAWAARAAQQARTTGDRARAELFEWWEARATPRNQETALRRPLDRTSPPVVQPQSSAPMTLNHTPGLLVGGHGQIGDCEGRVPSPLLASHKLRVP